MVSPPPPSSGGESGGESKSKSYSVVAGTFVSGREGASLVVRVTSGSGGAAPGKLAVEADALLVGSIMSHDETSLQTQIE